MGVPNMTNRDSDQRVCTLFVDGIAEEFGYHQVRRLFAHFGRLMNIFVQCNRKIGRRLRFGFVRFLSSDHASSAIKTLDGVRLGRASLSVMKARFSKD